MCMPPQLSVDSHSHDSQQKYEFQDNWMDLAASPGILNMLALHLNLVTFKFGYVIKLLLNLKANNMLNPK